MSGTAQGPVCIEIERPTFEASGEEYNITGYVVESPALLTRELQQQIERQNIDCRDINCMKWPIMGMSRWAEFKCLLLKSQLDRLISEPRPLTDDYNGYKIYFIVGSRQESTTTIFPRMVLADIKPLMVSEFGPQVPPVNPGDPETYKAEALYLCIFRCRRWAQRASRIVSDSIRDTKSQPSWYAGAMRATDYLLSRKQVVDDMFTAMGGEDGWPIISTVDVASTTPLAPPTPDPFPRRWDEITNYSLQQSQVPALQFIDDVVCRSDIMLSCIPKSDTILNSFLGQMQFNTYPVADGSSMMNVFLNIYGNDIIAGSVIRNLGEASYPVESRTGFASKCVVSYSTQSDIMPSSVSIYFPLFHYANGMPPDVFNVGDTSNFLSPPPESYAFYGDKWFDFNAGMRTGFDLPSISPAGKIGRSVINADEVPSYYRGRINDLVALGDSVSSTESNGIDYRSWPGTTLSERSAFANKYNAGICDLWIRGWVMPKPEELWAGAMFVELRLQTDGRGFGFPTTRIYGDIDDPLLGPLVDDGFQDIEATGLVSAWKTTTGRTRIHAEWPFGIPCMLRIYDHEEVAPNVWRYKCDTIQLADKDDTAPSGDNPTYHGGLRRAGYGGTMDTAYRVPAGKEIIAYNLTELANTSTFAGPGYKTPLTQAGFSVLPIGMDRDGNKSPVIVLAHLYQAPVPNFEDPDYFLTVAYFSLTNAVDGECDTSPLTEPDVDGGGFGET